MTAVRDRRVLVTGAGSGIGLACVQRLAADGWGVIAGARRPEHLAALAAIDGVTALRLDVAIAAEAEAARGAIAAGGARHGLVHNAGIGELGVLASWSDADVQRLFEVNVFGVLRLTRLLLPLLLAGRGRIVHVGSQGGTISGPFHGPYTMSKHALEAMNECLRQELAPHGVAVSIVQPGAVATSIGDNAAAGTLARLAAAPPPFDAASREVAARLTAPPQPLPPDAPESALNRKPCVPAVVADVIAEALGAAEPRPRYVVGTRWEGDRMLHMLIERLLDVAGSPSHRLSRDELIGCIDAQAARRGAAG